MRQSFRYAIAGLIGGLLYAAMAQAALRSSTETWGALTLLFARGVLAVATVGAVCRSPQERAWWLGFALFGWGYVALMSLLGDEWLQETTLSLAEGLLLKLGFTIPRRMQFHYGEVVESHLSLVAAILGGLLSRMLFAAPEAPAAIVTAPQPRDAERPRGWWHRPLALGAAGLVLVASTGLVGWLLDPRPAAGVTFLLTWGLIGLVSLAAVFRRGWARPSWVGAALFGAGYMILIFGWSPDWAFGPRTAVDQFLGALRPPVPPPDRVVPASSNSVALENARIQGALELQLPMRFPQPTPLRAVLKYIRTATKRPGRGPDLQIYVDPVGLNEAEKDMNSPVSIDLDAAPLKTTLSIVLRQLGLRYTIRQGVLWIISERADDESYPGAPQDPFLIIGHCVLALLAAGLGGLAAPLIAYPQDENHR
jgi:hypothetical protein